MLSVRRLVIPCASVTIVIVLWNFYTENHMGREMLEHVFDKSEDRVSAESQYEERAHEQSDIKEQAGYLQEQSDTKKYAQEQSDTNGYLQEQSDTERYLQSQANKKGYLHEQSDTKGYLKEQSDSENALSQNDVIKVDNRQYINLESVGPIVNYNESKGADSAGFLAALSDHQHKLHMENVTLSPVVRFKTILLWNSHFGKVDYGFGLGPEAFRAHGCEIHQCQLSTDRSHLSGAEAVMFHAFSTRWDEMPPRPSLDQVWIFFSMESPLTVAAQVLGTNDQYNLTYTYLADPDTDIAVGVRRLKVPSAYRPPPAFPDKSRAVVWAVSNCHTQSARARYARELSRHIPLDVYGQCGNLTCSKDHKHDCFRMFASKYHFFLAFENSFCRDYVTEKTFRTLKMDIVPVVMGGADYSGILPDKSVIDVRDFSSPQALAKYLLYLMENQTAYLEYFHWKTKPSFTSSHRLLQSKRAGFCKLCSILHNSTYTYKSGFDIEEYWSPERLCLSGRREESAVHLSRPQLASSITD